MRVRVSTLRRFVRKALREQAEGHQGRDFDHSPGYSSDADMARTQLKNIAARASKLHSSLKDDDDLPPWVLSKMAVADSYMTSLSDYLHGEMDRMQEEPGYNSEYGDQYSMDDMGSDDMEGALSSMLGGMGMDMGDSGESMDYDDEDSGYGEEYEEEEEEDTEGYGDPEMPEEDDDDDDDDDDDGDAEGYGDPEMPEEDDD